MTYSMCRRSLTLHLFAILMCILISVSDAMKHQNVVLRLLDMYRDKKVSNNSGTVAIRYQNHWGTICNTDWDINDAAVACRQMGYRGALKVGNFGVGNKKIILDGVNCTGNESKIEECKHNPWGGTSCKDGEKMAAGVACIKEKKINGVFDVRLYRGFDGLVEVRKGGIWGTICSDKWDIKAANVVCKHLGYSGAEKAYSIVDSTSRPVQLDNVQCKGNESMLHDCLDEDSWVTNTSKCANRSMAAVKCKLESKTQQQFALRLTGGTASYGTVEVYRYGRWGTVCDDGWDKQDADVVCRQLGFAYATTATREARFGQGTGDIFLSDVRCMGHEMSLAECHRTYSWGDSTQCQSYEAAGVICAQMKVQTVNPCAPMTKTLGKRVFFESPGYPDMFSYDGGTSCWCDASGMEKTKISIYVHDRQYEYNYQERLEFFWGRTHKGNVTRRRRVHGYTPIFAMGPFSFDAESFLLGFYDLAVAGEGRFRVEYRADKPITVTCHKNSANGVNTTLPPILPPPFHSKADDLFNSGVKNSGTTSDGQRTKILTVSQNELSKLIVASFFGGGLGMGIIILAAVLACYLGKKQSCRKKGHLKDNAYSVDVEECSESESRESAVDGAADESLTSEEYSKEGSVIFTNGRKRSRQVTFLLQAPTPPSERKNQSYVNEAYENYLDEADDDSPSSKSICEECENTDNNNNNNSILPTYPETDI